jgi:hypothetical protein
MIYCTADTKATPVSVQGVGVDFLIHMDFASPKCCERVRNITARFRSVFGSTDSPQNYQRTLRIYSLILITQKLPVYYLMRYY